jgi:hypothetical protein
MAENRIASIVNLAKATIMDLDPHAITTAMPTETIRLLCKTVIELGMENNPTAKAVQSAHTAMLQKKMTGSER